ncbi:unnamed protein product [Paramecium primaurelia]|uniref:Uncharacterized protein n=1 Tax=Paramecium primaurelia TaxID=5886 RepID=A0A8S1MRZ7_PARPR|nr:unnamed protein product [Paramecium primaurelia]
MDGLQSKSSLLLESHFFTQFYQQIRLGYYSALYIYQFNDNAQNYQGIQLSFCRSNIVNIQGKFTDAFTFIDITLRIIPNNEQAYSLYVVRKRTKKFLLLMTKRQSAQQQRCLCHIIDQQCSISHTKIQKYDNQFAVLTMQLFLTIGTKKLIKKIQKIVSFFPHYFQQKFTKQFIYENIRKYWNLLIKAIFLKQDAIKLKHKGILCSDLKADTLYTIFLSVFHAGIRKKKEAKQDFYEAFRVDRKYSFRVDIYSIINIFVKCLQIVFEYLTSSFINLSSILLDQLNLIISHKEQNNTFLIAFTIQIILIKNM